MKYRVHIHSGDIHARLSVIADTRMGASEKAFAAFREHYGLDDSVLVSITEVELPEMSPLDWEGEDMRHPVGNADDDGGDVKWL